MFLKHISFFLVLLGFLLTSCAENITEARDTPAPVPGNQSPNLMRALFSQIQDSVFTPSCALSGCHSGAVFPNLSAGQAYGNIVDQPSSLGDYIEPGDAMASYLYLKIIDDPAISGARMPRNAAPLSQAKLDSIEQWIEAGALNN